MLIFFNGDSNTAGNDLNDPDTEGYYAVMSKHYNAKWINRAMGGVSPNWIINSTRAYLAECYQSGVYPDLVVIGWSEWSRTEVFYKGRLRAVADITVSDPELYRHYDKVFKQQEIQSAAMAVYYNQQIKNLHDELAWMDIPHLFFNAIESFAVTDYAKENIFLHDWKNYYFAPYVQPWAMREWALANKYKEMIPGWAHFEPAAQTAWAKILIDHIDQHKILGPKRFYR